MPAARHASSVTGGQSNMANGPWSSVSGGDFNIAAYRESWIGPGCDNLTGSGSASTLCDSPGGEALLGGAGQTLTGTDTHPP